MSGSVLPCAGGGCSEYLYGFAAAAAPRTSAGLWYCEKCREKRGLIVRDVRESDGTDSEA